MADLADYDAVTPTISSAAAVDLSQLTRAELEELCLQCSTAAAAAQSRSTNETELAREHELACRDLEAAKERIDGMMNEQARMEEELAGRIEVLEKLRASMRELERDKRDAFKRYREQADSFESERQAWYDQEQHYKLRVANLSKAAANGKAGGRRRRAQHARNASQSSVDGDGDDDGTNRQSLHDSGRESDADSTARLDSDVACDDQSSTTTTSYKHTDGGRSTRSSTSPSSPEPSQDGGEAKPTAQELALQDQLESLTTAHTSLTTTLRALQVEMTDLKRVYRNLQEENESYEVLLGEKTLNGDVRGSDLFRRSFQWGEVGADGEEGDGDEGEHAFGFLGGLHPVGESNEEDYELSSEGEDEDERADEVDPNELRSPGTGSVHSGAVSVGNTPASPRQNRRRKSLQSRGGAGKSPRVSGDKKSPGKMAAGSSAGGLDLAAELEAAEDGVDSAGEEIERRRAAKLEKKRRASKAALGAERRTSLANGPSIEELKSEVKQLREANKALTLYVSKIVDRVCSQEGFEKVLAVDYRTTTPKVARPMPAGPPAPLQKSPTVSAPASNRGSDASDQDVIKFRPGSMFRLNTAGSVASSIGPASAAASATGTAANPASFATPTSSSRRVDLGLGPRDVPSTPFTPTAAVVTPNSSNRKSGLGWDSVTSVFNLARAAAAAATSPSPTAASSGSGPARRLMRPSGEEEDEEDQRERERLRLEMMKLGIDGSAAGNQWGQPSIPSAKMSVGSRISLSAPPPPSKDLTDKTEPQGLAAGFTAEPETLQFKRRPTNIRTTSSGSAVPLGLGILDDNDSLPPPPPPSNESKTSPRPASAGTGEEEGGWAVGKHIRRLSRNFSSPPVA